MAVPGARDARSMHADSHIISSVDKLGDDPMPDATASAAAAAYLNTPPTTPQTITLSAASLNLNSTSNPNGKAPRSSQLSLSDSITSTDTIMASPVNKMACARCKQKKIKCDARQPACSACVRAKEKCIVPDIISHGAYSRGHVDALENRMSELQSLIDTKTREISDLKGRHGSISSIFTNSPASSNPFTPGKRSSATSMPPSIMGQTPDLSKPENTLADLALARLLIQTLHLRDHGPCISKLSHLFSNETSVAFESINAATNLPPADVGETLCISYLENEQLCFPFISRTNIVSIYQRIYGDPSQLSAEKLEDYFRLYMIFAIACLAHPPGIDDPQVLALQFYKAALSYKKNIPVTTRLATVQNTLLLCLFSLHTKISQDAWWLSRRALHIAVEGEFHLSRPTSTQESKEAAEIDRMQRCVFWSAYCLNRLTSNLIYDRPPSIPEASIEAKRPPDFEQDLTAVEEPTPYLILHLINLYGLSTQAFTSFNSADTPPSDMVSHLIGNTSILSFYSDNALEYLKSQFPKKPEPTSLAETTWVPPYLTLSFGSQAMLMHQWAMTSIAARYGSVPLQVQMMAIGTCITTINFLAAGFEPIMGAYSYRFGHLRIAFTIMLRSLVALLSALLAKSNQDLPIVANCDTTFTYQQLDDAVVLGLKFLRDVGSNQGQGCEFLPALVLAFRYAILDMGLNGKSPAYQNQRAEKMPFGRREEAYWTVLEFQQTNFPKFSRLAEEMEVSSLPLGLSLKAIEDMNEGDIPPSHVFNKFGKSGKALEELIRQVPWRLKVQYEIGDADTSLHAFQERMGTGRVMETGYPGFSMGGNGFNQLEGMDVSIDEGYQPIVNFEMGGSGLPKMDVDFSGFETNIVTFE